MRLIIFLGILSLLWLNHFDEMMLVFVLLRMYLITNRHHYQVELNQPRHFGLRIDHPIVLYRMIFAICPPIVHGIYSNFLGCQLTVLVGCNSLSDLLTNFVKYVMMYAKMPVNCCGSCSYVRYSPWYLVMLTNLDIPNVFQTLFVNGMYYSSIQMCYVNDHLYKCRTLFS